MDSHGHSSHSQSSHTHGHSHTESDEEPQPIDPEYEMDGKKTARWLVAWTLCFAFSWYLLLVFFDLCIESERTKKIDKVDPTDLRSLRQTELKELSTDRENPDGTRRVSIDAALELYTKQKK